jgi:photosystem II stability/assembly factor-like uncharacterized protein
MVRPLPRLQRRAACRALAAIGLSGSGWAWAADAMLRPLERQAVALRDPRSAILLGLAQAGKRLVAVGEHGVVLLSEDDGATWRQSKAVPVSVTLTAVQFVDDKTGWAVGHGGVVLRSDDGGEQWTRQLEGVQLAQLLLDEAKAGANAKAVTAAERAVQEGADKPLLALHFTNANDGLAIGAFGTMLATADGGKTWRSVSARLDNPKGAHLYALSRSGPDILLAGEQGLVLHSPDGGATFARIATPYQGSWFCVARGSDGAWLVAGLRGNAMRSRDAGKSWTVLASPAPVSYTVAGAAGKGPLLLANQGGDVMAVAPGSDRLEPVARSGVQQPGAMLRLVDGSLVVAGWSGVAKVTPGDRQ